MGDRAGYRIRVGGDTSDLIKTQWVRFDMREFVADIANALLYSYNGQKTVGSGSAALRSDLNMERMTAALFSVVYSSPFDSIHKDTRCDISDNGLFEIELVEWNHWCMWNYKVIPGKQKNGGLYPRTLIAEITFVDGMAMPDAMKFDTIDGAAANE